MNGSKELDKEEIKTMRIVACEVEPPEVWDTLDIDNSSHIDLHEWSAWFGRIKAAKVHCWAS